MPFVETVADLAEALADLVGVYGGHDEGEAKPCRICWVEGMQTRIIEAVANESLLAAVPPAAGKPKEGA